MQCCISVGSIQWSEQVINAGVQRVGILFDQDGLSRLTWFVRERLLKSDHRNFVKVLSDANKKISLTLRSMAKMAPARKNHSYVMFVACSNHFRVITRSTGLNYCSDTGLCCFIHSVTKGKKSIARKHTIR